jgi:arginyl-tRNA synthetase
MALTKAKSEIEKRHVDWSKKQINKVARVIAFGALKFEMVKVGSDRSITFDIDTALRFDGFTAAYLQYTYARLQSIVRKAPSSLRKTATDLARLSDAREKHLIMTLGNFPAIIETAGQKKDPAEIAKYLFDLGQVTNDYYHAVPVLKAESPADAAARLNLLQAVGLVIQQGLNLLGIETVEEM